MDNALKAHCPNCTFVNANTMQKCANCNTTLRKRHRSHENEEDDEEYSDDEINYGSYIQSTTSVRDSSNSVNKAESNMNVLKQNTRSSLPSPLSSSCEPHSDKQSGVRMISTLFSTAAGAPVMVSEASLQKAKLKYGNGIEESYSDNNSSQNNTFTSNVNLAPMNNELNGKEYETKLQYNDNNNLTKSHTFIKLNEESRLQTNQQNKPLESELLSSHEEDKHLEEEKQSEKNNNEQEESETEEQKEEQQQGERQQAITVNTSNLLMEKRLTVTEINTNAKDTGESDSNNTATSKSGIVITPASNLLQPARIGLRPGARRGFVPPQRIKEVSITPKEINKATTIKANAQFEAEKETQIMEEQPSNQVESKVEGTSLLSSSSSSSSLAITTALEMKSAPVQRDINAKENIVTSPSTSTSTFTSTLNTFRNGLASKPQIKLNKLSAVGFDYHTLKSEPARDIPTIGAIMSDEFAFSTILCSDALRAVCGLTPNEVHLNSKHWQHMLIALGASEAHVPLDWITHIVHSSIIEVRALATAARSFLCKHVTETLTNALTKSNNTMACPSALNTNKTASSSSLSSSITCSESSSTPNLFFAPTTVALYVCEKYNTEIVHGQRSALREVVESDVPSASLMILQLTEVCPDRSAPHTRVVRLSDGFYHLKVHFDLPLSNLLREKVLCVGQKIAICGARYLLPQPTSPLECLEKLVLAVNYNCVRAVSMQSPLGLCHCQPAPLSIHLVHPNGGMVSALQGMVIRTLPVFYISHEVREGRRSESGMKTTKIVNNSITSSDSIGNSINAAAPLSLITHKVIRNAYAQQREFSSLASQIRKHCIYSTDNDNDEDGNNMQKEKLDNSNNFGDSTNISSSNKGIKSLGVSTIKVSCVRSVVIANDGVEALIQQWHDWDLSKMNTEELLHFCDGACELSDDGMNVAGEGACARNSKSTDDGSNGSSNKKNSTYHSCSEDEQAPHEGSEIVIYALKPSKSQMACAPFAHAKLFYSARHLHFTQVRELAHYQRSFVASFETATSHKMGSVVDVVGLFVGTVQLPQGTFILLLMEGDTYGLLQVPLPEPHRVLSFAFPSRLNVPLAVCNATFVCYEDKIAGSDCTRMFANEFTALLSEQQCKATYLRTALKRAAELVELINTKPHKYTSRIANILESLQEVANNHNNSVNENINSGNNGEDNDKSKAETSIVATTLNAKMTDQYKSNHNNYFVNDDNVDNTLSDRSTRQVNAVTSPIAITDLSEENAWDEMVGNTVIGANSLNENSNYHKITNSSAAGQRRVFSPTARVPYYMRNEKKSINNGVILDNNKNSSGSNNSNTPRTVNGVKLISREQELSMTIPAYTATTTKETLSSAPAVAENTKVESSAHNRDVYHFYGNIIDITYVHTNANDALLLNGNNVKERGVCFLRGESIDSIKMVQNESSSYNVGSAGGVENGFCADHAHANTSSTINDVSKHNTAMLPVSLYITWQYGKEQTECKRARIKHSSLLHTLLESVIPLRKLCSLASDDRETNLALERNEIIAQWGKAKLHLHETNGRDGSNDKTDSEHHNEWWRFFSTSIVIDRNNKSSTNINIKEAFEQQRLCWLLTEWQTAMQLLRQALRRTLFKFTVVSDDTNDDGQNEIATENESQCLISDAYLISDHCDVRSLFS